MRITLTLATITLLAGCSFEFGGGLDTRSDGFDGNRKTDMEGGSFDPTYGECLSDEVLDSYALCVCEDFHNVGSIELRQIEPDLPASIGVNGHTNLVNEVLVEGSWHAHGGFDAVLGIHIAGDLITAGSVSWVGEQVIDGDLMAGGSVDGVGSLEVGGTLGVRGGVSIVGSSSVGDRGLYRAPAHPPCACDASEFDVAGAVAAVRDDNDNALADLEEDGTVTLGDKTLTLSTGRYYLQSLAHVGERTIHIDGQVALYVDGDIVTVGEDTIEIADGGSLDLYVAGSVGTVGNVRLGNPADPAAFRLLIGGDDGVLVSVGQQAFFGQIYAPRAEIDYVGRTLIVGSLLAKRLDGVGELIIEHTAAQAPPEEVCDPEDVREPR